MFSKIIAIFALAAAVSATPTGEKTGELSVEQAAVQCGNGSKLSCCNNGDGTLLAANCLVIPIIAIPLGNACSGGNIATCCPVNQDGNLNINVQCVPITL
ncbi:unnamed protein product [Periconia digitata]|uniref:Hydrophobin n=1 Tax=Periconia digitata TaxID=1303443 RepID=A0A9W4UAG3_9PLEO|nr:unnamed protein product [Periconia digitata]